jgi:oligopeptide transport system ATP-binding protein
MPHMLEVKNLVTRFYTEGNVIHAVNGISYSLDEGEAMAIVGESGSGKSVGVMSVMGLIRYPPGKVVSGEIHFKGRDLRALSDEELRQVRGKEIAMIFQDPMTSLNPVLPVGLQLTEALQAHQKVSPQEAQQRAVEVLGLVGLPNPAGRLKDFPFQFSGGQRQRIMIAMALIGQPSLLIADEPTTALDVTIQAQIVELVQRIRQQVNMSVIWITHDLGVVAEMAERVIVMYAGFIVEEAGVDNLYEDPRHPYTQALLAALPRVDKRRDRRLLSIPGAPPNLLVAPKGCPFVQRCQFAFDHCREEMPPLISVGLNHQAACWLDVTTGKTR